MDITLEQPNLIEILNWGYETSGDLDEAINVYYGFCRSSGKQVRELTPDERTILKTMFKKEFTPIY